MQQRIDLAAIGSIATMLTAVIGLVSAVIVSRKRGRQLQTIQVLVNGNLMRVQEDLKAAVERIAELENEAQAAHNAPTPPDAGAVRRAPEGG